MKTYTTDELYEFFMRCECLISEDGEPLILDEVGEDFLVLSPFAELPDDIYRLEVYSGTQGPDCLVTLWGEGEGFQEARYRKVKFLTSISPEGL